MAKTRKGAYEAQTVNTARPVEQALPAEARLSGGDRFVGRHQWLVWLGAAVVVGAAASWGLAWLGVAVVGAAVASWGLVTYVDRVGQEFFSKGQDVVVTLSTIARVLRSR